MSSVIKQFFYGEPVCDKIPRGKSYQKAYDEFCLFEEKFIKLLSKEQYDAYKELEVAMFGVAAEGEEDTFILGFKYGLAFALESQRTGII